MNNHNNYYTFEFADGALYDSTFWNFKTCIHSDEYRLYDKF